MSPNTPPAIGFAVGIWMSSCCMLKSKDKYRRPPWYTGGWARILREDKKSQGGTRRSTKSLDRLCCRCVGNTALRDLVCHKNSWKRWLSNQNVNGACFYDVYILVVFHRDWLDSSKRDLQKELKMLIQSCETLRLSIWQSWGSQPSSQYIYWKRNLRDSSNWVLMCNTHVRVNNIHVVIVSLYVRNNSK